MKFNCKIGRGKQFIIDNENDLQSEIEDALCYVGEDEGAHEYAWEVVYEIQNNGIGKRYKMGNLRIETIE